MTDKIMPKIISNSTLDYPLEDDTLSNKPKSENTQNDLLTQLLVECKPLEEALKQYGKFQKKRIIKVAYSITHIPPITVKFIPPRINHFRKKYKAFFPLEIASSNASSFYLLAAMYPFMQHLSNQEKQLNEINVLRAICGEKSIQFAPIQKESNLQELVDLLCPPEKTKVTESIKLSEKELLFAKRMEFKRLFSTIQNQDSHMFNSYALRVRICNSEQKCINIKIENLITEFAGEEKKMISNFIRALYIPALEVKCATCNSKPVTEQLVPVILSPILIFHNYAGESKYTYLLEESIDFSNSFNDPISKMFSSPSDKKFGNYWLVSFSMVKSGACYVKNVFKDQWYLKEGNKTTPISFDFAKLIPIRYAVYVKEELFYLSNTFLEEELNKWKLENLLK